MGRLTALVVLTLPVALAAAPVPTHLMPKPDPMTFPTEVGTTWTYQKKDLVVTRSIIAVEVKGKVKIVRIAESLGDQESAADTIEIRSGGWYWTHIGNVELRSPCVLLKLPCKAGESWDADAHGSKSTIKERERVTVPAGKFEAIRVRCSYAGPEGLRCWCDRWYADGIGEVKYVHQSGEEQVLKSFTRGK